MKTLLIFLLHILLISHVYGQSLNALTPALTPLIKESSEGYTLFLNLWEYSLKMDTSTVNPTNRVNLEPKTLLLPGDFAMAHLVPQDGTHPLFLNDPVHSQLRKEFILDHLVLDALPKNSPGLDSEDGISTTTLSGKSIVINRGPRGALTVGDVRVKKTVLLDNGMQIYVLEEPLFNQTQKVRSAFNDFHKIESNVPTGPPLDIPDSPPGGGLSIARAPAPPPPGIIFPPAAPPADFLTNSEQNDFLPPSPPIPGSDSLSNSAHPKAIFPPAPPRNFLIKKAQNELHPPAPPKPTSANAI